MVSCKVPVLGQTIMSILTLKGSQTAEVSMTQEKKRLSWKKRQIRREDTKRQKSIYVNFVTAVLKRYERNLLPEEMEEIRKGCFSLEDETKKVFGVECGVYNICSSWGTYGFP